LLPDASKQRPGWLKGGLQGLQNLRRNVSTGLALAQQIQISSPEPTTTLTGGVSSEAEDQPRKWLQPIRGLIATATGGGRDPREASPAVVTLVAAAAAEEVAEQQAVTPEEAGLVDRLAAPVSSAPDEPQTPNIEAMGRLFHISEFDLDD